MKKTIIMSVVVGVIIISALAGFYFQRKNYEVVSPKKGDIVEAIYGLGKVVANHRFEVKIGVMDSVAHLYVKEGDEVKKGSPLIRFDQGTSFKAPFDGTVTFINNYEGEIAQPQVTLLRLEDLKDRFIEVSLEQEGALRVKKNQKAKVIFESLRSEMLEGEVVALFPKEGDFIVHIKVNKLGPNILPGMTADVSIEVGQIEGATLVPLKAINNGMVIVKKNNRRKKVKVDVGHVDGFWAEIKNDSILLTDEILVKKEKN